MARKPKPGGDRDPITIRAARIGGKYSVAAAVVGAVVAAAAAVGFGLLVANAPGAGPNHVRWRIPIRHVGYCH